MKKVQVNTPLILEQNGELVRIEAGQIIDLADDVYAEISAHTTLLDNKAPEEPVFEPQPAPDEAATEVEKTAHGDTLGDEVAATETAEPKKSIRKKA
ncbi:hypothetical protein SAMN02745664_101284 [Moraxella cuniculi DSM 21768]|uniref:Uncharacterized protein n=1 Tax=Moraxella cuniculi DSM 21768 TaxID=1122245 RepID=A0A1N7DI72_9GAMM|nr:hypothetical protein [Moraxella cuniculi]OOS08078.1 hypothetical protein B0189_01725 [Moraxella cuniculi]SIR75501.1 hypothetical protein SAMN02745664_101284 [Moraxella cuniculi DSM 21768]